ncbi:hypothetical protein M407DRAFT_15507 [Tulasnella calospora MUT 4182]|uniref:Guanine nucleotide-binding protein subunit alpha n=1 Tax=Tulasnella calospora MUT 4182 TaxID=1051891 RepID=A0A0C3QDX2_9AGAM|nr:hypothetical protein M407DRAFT_15507 [Tulasnella calospora MUT 4182]
MGANISTEQRELERSMAIDKQIEADSRRLRSEQKVLLLGTPGSGKSTIMKQMKIIHQNGYTPDELAAFRLDIYQNLVDSAKDVVLALHKLGLECVEEINKTYAAQILEYKVESDPSFRLAPDIANAIDSLWKDPTIAIAVKLCSEFHLPDSASYLFSNVQRIAQKDYLPSERDVLRAKTKTKPAGIMEISLHLAPCSIRIVDVSNQRSERKKWIHCFEAVTSIIFCAGLSDYDQVLLENKEQTRMTESLILFESVPSFSSASVILFSTKIEVLKAKLGKAPLEMYFPEYTGEHDINKAAKFIMSKYMQANRANLRIYSQYIRVLLAATEDTILQNALESTGILRDTKVL